MIDHPVRTRRPHAVDLDTLAAEIHAITPDRELSRSPLPAATMLQPQPDIGKLSADAVLEQYNMAAKSIEDMGNEVQQRVRALEAALKDCEEDMRLLREAAEMVKEKGKHAHAEIERTSAVSKDIRDIVAAIKDKLA